MGWGTNTLLEMPNKIYIKNSNCQPAGEGQKTTPSAFVPITLGAGLFLQGHRILGEQFTNRLGSLEKEGLQNSPSFRTQRKVVPIEKENLGMEVESRKRKDKWRVYFKVLFIFFIFLG